MEWIGQWNFNTSKITVNYGRMGEFVKESSFKIKIKNSHSYLQLLRNSVI